MQISDSELSVTLAIAYLILVSLDNGAKMSPKRRILLSLVFACTVKVAVVMSCKGVTKRETSCL